MQTRKHAQTNTHAHARMHACKHARTNTQRPTHTARALLLGRMIIVIIMLMLMLKLIRMITPMLPLHLAAVPSRECGFREIVLTLVWHTVDVCPRARASARTQSHNYARAHPHLERAIAEQHAGGIETLRGDVTGT